MSRPRKHVFRLITVRCLIALGVIAAALTGAYFLLGQAIEMQQGSSRIVALAARQVFSTQRVCFLSHMVVNAKTAESRQIYRENLDRAITDLEQSHEVLSLRRNPEEIPTGMRFLLRNTYYSEPEPVDEQVNQLLRDARTILKADGQEFAPGNAEISRLTEAGSRTLVNRQRQIFNLLREKAQQSVNGTRRLGAVLWLLALALLAVEALLIFYPMARRASNVAADLDAARRKAENEAQAAMAARDSQASFLRTMSHELRTPLNAILGMTQLMKSRISPEKRSEYTEDIHQAGRHLLNLINDILEFSRLEAKQFTIELAPTPLKDELEWTVSLLRPVAAEKKLDLNYQVDPGLARCYLADGPRIRQVLVNLVGNALKFTQRGSIRVSAVYEGSAGEAADLVRFEVRDTGIGVPSDMRKRIFEEFQQADNALVRKHGGSGLGLAISSRLVKLMNGEIGVESIEGNGSVFWFTLPLQWTAGTWPQRTGTGSRRATHRRLCVLVVDDIEDSREHLKDRLSRMGHEVIAAGTSCDALAAAMESTPDVILIDVDRLGMRAAAATRAIRELPEPFAGVFIIALASEDSDAAVGKVLNAGADLYLGKPLDFELVRSHLAKRGRR